MTSQGHMLLLACGTALLLLVAASTDTGKRFDCNVFCKSTGFSGVVGGCRCSFTLFTSKRTYTPGPPHHMRTSGGPDFSLLRQLFSRPLRRRGLDEDADDTQLAGNNMIFDNTYE